MHVGEAVNILILILISCTMQDLSVRVIGLNTIKCPEQALHVRILYRRSRLRFAYTDSEKLKELKTKLNGTGIAIVTPSPEDTNGK